MPKLNTYFWFRGFLVIAKFDDCSELHSYKYISINIMSFFSGTVRGLVIYIPFFLPFSLFPQQAYSLFFCVKSVAHAVRV